MVISVLGLATMLWHMFVVKKLSSAAFLIDKVTIIMSLVSCVAVMCHIK